MYVVVKKKKNKQHKRRCNGNTLYHLIECVDIVRLKQIMLYRSRRKQILTLIDVQKLTSISENNQMVSIAVICR